MTNFLKAIVLVTAIVATSGLSETTNGAVEDETSLSHYQIVEEDQSILTISELELLGSRAKQLFAEGKCEEGASLDFAGSANVAANILRQGLEPYYKADRDSRNSIYYNDDLFNELVSAEEASNKYIKDRNETWFLEAKCFYERGDAEKALVRLYRVLEFINAEGEDEIWEKARVMIWSIIGYE